MFAKDVMTSPVVTISLSTPVRDITELLRDRRIGGVPVVDAVDALVGIVSESDLLQRYEAGQPPAAARPWWCRMLLRSEAPLRYVRSHGTRACDVMTHGAVSVREDTPLAEVASLFARRHIHRVPVMRGRRLVGIVASSDLVKALAESGQPAAAGPRSDADIQASLEDELSRQGWWSDTWSQVVVEDGIVSYHGLLESEAARDAARVAAENIDGVRGVIDERIRAADMQAMC
ncbi:CBS domain-containing protein [Variovorax sp. dw_954]|uniref:CBS domain-containing protein n=1 Tax=Variovorax sp. dw_954 TaxID=2720078 RepID=UPI001BD56C1B|nr:CBS domain-containing protein [Variovorax sp. dw_954]